MKEWLLKDEKAKVGRPKLADETVLKKAKLTICLSLFLCVLFSFYFAGVITGENPLKLAYHVSLEKVFGAIENKNGFLVNYKYDDNYNYVMEFKIPQTIDRYSGSYEYTLYEMNENEWKEVESKRIDKGTSAFKVTVKSEKNQNKTWKIKLQILDAAKIEESYAPAGWTFMNAGENKDMYAYKVFTVKGYYSPVTLEEINEAKKNQDKITVTTERSNPRLLTINLPDSSFYDVKVTYTDTYSKKVVLVDDKEVSGKNEYEVPNINKITNATVKVYGDNLSSLKLSNWKEDKDKNGNSYITNTYLLKPEQTYDY